MTTITSQIQFMETLRESFDNQQREAVLTKYDEKQVAEYLRDIEENLIALRLNWERFSRQREKDALAYPGDRGATMGHSF